MNLMTEPTYIKCTRAIATEQPRISRIVYKDGSTMSMETYLVLDKTSKSAVLSHISHFETQQPATTDPPYEICTWFFAREQPNISRVVFKDGATVMMKDFFAEEDKYLKQIISHYETQGRTGKFRPPQSSKPAPNPTPTAGRPSWNEYFMRFAELAATRSKDLSRHVGAVLVDKRHNIISTGYNGFPRGVIESGERLERPLKYSYVIHAEENCIASAAARGVSTYGSRLYCTHPPCAKCAGLIVQSGVQRVYYPEGVTVETMQSSIDIGKRILEEGGVIVNPLII